MPDTTATTATTALDRLLELTVVLGRDMGGHLADQGLTDSRAHVLFVLHATGPTTQRTLADALDVVPRTMTGLVDGLVSSGHVTREPHPSDGRATLVTPTPLGATAAAALSEGRTQLADALFHTWSTERTDALVAALDDVLATLHTLLEEQA